MSTTVLLLGFIVDFLGSRSCFLIDSSTFLMSAFLLWLIHGEYNVSDTTTATTTNTTVKEGRQQSTLLETIQGMVDGAKYLWSSFFAALIFLKGSCALSYGACDVLNVVLSEEGDGRDKDKKLGILFSLVGTGCLLGPLLTEPFVNVERPSTVQSSCVFSFALSVIGYLGWSFDGSSFWVISIFALIRAAGSSIIWINSTILLQKFSSPEMLGRVLATDYAIALSAEALSALTAGILMDNPERGLSAYDVSFVLAIQCFIFTFLWAYYHVSGHGAMKYHQDSPFSSLNDKEPGVEQNTEASSLVASGLSYSERVGNSTPTSNSALAAHRVGDLDNTTRDDLDLELMDHNWAAVGATAALLAADSDTTSFTSRSETPTSLRCETPISFSSRSITAGGNSIREESTVSSCDDEPRLDQLVSAGDWEGVIFAAEKFETTSTVASKTGSESSSCFLVLDGELAKDFSQRLHPGEIQNGDEVTLQVNGRDDNLGESRVQGDENKILK